MCLQHYGGSMAGTGPSWNTFVMTLGSFLI